MVNDVSPPEKLSPWLFHEDSLTEKLKSTTGNSSIQVLGQGLFMPSAWDKEILGISEGLEFVREIIMYSHERRCWYARTLAPELTYQVHHDFFSRLERNALHVMLFQDRLAVRQSMTCYAISKNEPEFYWVKPFLFSHEAEYGFNSVMLWVRRSCFLIGGKEPFYLLEIFFPEFLDLLV